MTEQEIQSLLDTLKQEGEYRSSIESIALSTCKFDGEIRAIQCEITDSYNNKSYHKRKMMYLTNKCNTEEDIEIAIRDWCENIFKCVSRVRHLNDAIDDCMKSERTVRIEFRLKGTNVGIGIERWDFDSVVLDITAPQIERTFDESLCELANLLGEYINVMELANNINKDKLMQFLNYSLAIEYNFMTENFNSINLLEFGYYKRCHLVDLIKKRKRDKGILNVLTTVSSEDLSFIGKMKWKVDYGNKKVTSEIIDNKLLDIRDGTYIRDKATLECICELVKLSRKELDEAFN